MLQDQSVWVNVALLVVLVLVLYFFFLRPDHKAKRARAQLQNQLKVGDRVYTRVGVHGTVTAINGDLVLLETGKSRTELEVLRSSILTESEASGTRGRNMRTLPTDPKK